MAERNGEVKVLLSGGQFNNFECRRPLRKDATDEEYSAEFQKALELADCARIQSTKRSESQELFHNLWREYRYLEATAPAISMRPKKSITDREKVLLKRYELYKQIVIGYISPYEWDDSLNDSLSEQAYEDDPPF